MRNTFIASLCDLAEQDERIWLLCGDLGYSVLEKFAERFPDRYINVGVAEQNMMGVSRGYTCPQAGRYRTGTLRASMADSATSV